VTGWYGSLPPGDLSAFYNTFDEIDVFLRAVRRIAEGGTNVG